MVLVEPKLLKIFLCARRGVVVLIDRARLPIYRLIKYKCQSRSSRHVIRSGAQVRIWDAEL